MSDDPQVNQEMTEIREGDILFDCPFCGKNMAIEAAGAGLMVPCATCGKRVQVPIPDQETPDAPVATEASAASTVSVAEADSENPEELIRQLDAALSMSNKQVDQLMEEKEALQERRAYLEQMRSANVGRLKEISDELETMQNAMDRALVLLASVRAEKPV
jgi:transcription elongation factor Elf1